MKGKVIAYNRRDTRRKQRSARARPRLLSS